MTNTPADKALKDLLARLSQSPAAETGRQDVLVIQQALATSHHALAYVCMVKIVENAASATDRDERLISIFQPLIEPFFIERPIGDAQNESLVSAVAVLTALFPLAPLACVSLLTTPADPDQHVDQEDDTLAVLLEAAELDGELQLALASLCASAAGVKQGRKMVRSRALEWLRGGLRLTDREGVSGLCAVALGKLGRDTDPDQGPDQSSVTAPPASDLDLCTAIIAALENSTNRSDRSTLPPLLEGLSVLSTHAAVKQHLVSHPTFLRSLLSLSPVPQQRGGSLPVTPRGSITSLDDTLYKPADLSLCYGITTILVNISARKPVLSADEEQIAKLRAMAIAGKKGAVAGPDRLDEAPAVQARVAKLYAAGAVAAMHGLARAESLNVKQLLGRLCLNLVEDRVLRSGFIKDGGFKVLSEVVRKLLVAYDGNGAKVVNGPTLSSAPLPGSSDAAAIDLLPALQALAKLVITTPPNLLFPPPHLMTSLNALTPTYILLTHPTSTLLQTFEALMALTNLASISPEIADRIVSATITPRRTEELWRGSNRDDTVRIVARVEECMVEDNELVRRAATELMCNLAGSEKGFTYFSGEGERKVSAKVSQRLHFLLVLTDLDDMPTRLAAGGALAILTESASACAALLDRSNKDDSAAEPKSTGRSTWKRLGDLLEPEEVEDDTGEKIALISTTPPDPGLILRTVCILHNLLQYVTELDQARRAAELARVKEEGVEKALMDVLRMTVGEEVLRPVVTCLKLIKKG